MKRIIYVYINIYMKSIMKNHLRLFKLLRKYNFSENIIRKYKNYYITKF